MFDCRFIIGMERSTYPKLGFFSGHDDVIDGTWSLCAYLVASWHGISSRGHSSFPKYKGKLSVLLHVDISPFIGLDYFSISRLF